MNTSKVIILSTILFLIVACSKQEAAQNVSNAKKETSKNLIGVTNTANVKSKPHISEENNNQDNNTALVETTTLPKEDGINANKVNVVKSSGDNKKQDFGKTKPNRAGKQQIKFNTAKTTSRPRQQKTVSADTFYVIGISKTIDYDDDSQFEKALESLWSSLIAKDFSGKLSGTIVSQMKIYTVYSDYDEPKGKMTITLGYKVKTLSTIPSGLAGKTIMANDFLVYRQKGNESDYTSAGWGKLESMLENRISRSSDFHIYFFDGNFEITKGQLWIATK